MSIIVLEGPDMAGKTTLATQFVDIAPHYVLHKQGPPSGDILEQYLRPIQDRHTLLSENRMIMVMDRWHIGELIYGPLLRGQSLLTERQADYIDMVLQTYGCTFLHVTAPLNVLEDRYDIRGDDLIKKSDLLVIRDSYDVVFMTRPHWVTISISFTDNISQMWQRMISGSSPKVGAYIGPVKPKVLLLGDERASDKFIFPFVPERATSGHWLMGAMYEADVNHMDVGIINACEISFDDLYFQWRQLGRPPVITLGRNAEKAWHTTTGVAPESTYLHHPQYMRRFHYTSMLEYGTKIKEVMDHG